MGTYEFIGGKSQVILKTAVRQLEHPVLDNGSAIMGQGQGYYTFRCACSDLFRLRDTNRFTSWDDIQCSDCKRIGRLAPYIGERYVFRRIKWDAKKSGRSFNISFEWFVKAVHLPCHYCNRTDINSVTVASKIPGEVLLADFRYNGLDRVDNSIGYEEDNCVPCCVVCNRAKNSMPYDEFMQYIHQLVNHQNSVGDENVYNEHSISAARIPYRGRHRKTGKYPNLEESPSNPVCFSDTHGRPNIYIGADGTLWFPDGSGSYRKAPGPIQAQEKQAQ